jgi:2-polyprenyl-6-methoxyphenol hydroxylase-like FAD-dependent oxidoreductase
MRSCRGSIARTGRWHVLLATALAIVAASGTPATGEPHEPGVHDVIIAGGGLAGLATASLLQALVPDASVLVVEKRRGIRDDAAGLHEVVWQDSFLARSQVLGLRGSTTLSVLQRSLPHFTGLRVSSSAVVPGGRGVPRPTSRQLAPVLPAWVYRSADPLLDIIDYDTNLTERINQLGFSLLRTAQRRGTRFLFDSEIVQVQPRDRRGRIPVQIRRSGGPPETIYARWIGGTDGAGGALADQLGLQRTRPVEHGTLATVWLDGVTPGHRVTRTAGFRDGGILLVDERGGFALVPLAQELGKIALGLLDGRPGARDELRQAFDEHLLAVLAPLLATESPRVRVSEVVPIRIRNWRRLEAVAPAHGVLLAGEALGPTDPLLQGGANQALADADRLATTLAELLTGAASDPASVQAALQAYAEPVLASHAALFHANRLLRDAYLPQRLDARWAPLYWSVRDARSWLAHATDAGRRALLRGARRSLLELLVRDPREREERWRAMNRRHGGRRRR